MCTVSVSSTDMYISLCTVYVDMYISYSTVPFNDVFVSVS